MASAPVLAVAIVVMIVALFGTAWIVWTDADTLRPGGAWPLAMSLLALGLILVAAAIKAIGY